MEEAVSVVRNLAPTFQHLLNGAFSLVQQAQILPRKVGGRKCPECAKLGRNSEVWRKRLLAHFCYFCELNHHHENMVGRPEICAWTRDCPDPIDNDVGVPL